MRWTGMVLLGFVILISGVAAALWKLRILASIGTAWTMIGLIRLVGIVILPAVSNSGSK